ncbi:MAG: RsmB/NOP family class I SAM-dependent RNA methyltransferase [Alphaproteobacteria bacterium]|nr:RsmB/NOP family class I SAM-dependent RNA methyltransferase [Alphaproteobacteria bacterium]
MTNSNDEESAGLAARQSVLDLLENILQRKQALDHALENTMSFKTLPARDRAFARMMVATILRRMGQIDALIEKAIAKKETPRSLKLQNILRLGVAQILFMEVADHAAVDTAVRLAQSHGMEWQKAFVNALLRTITRTGGEWLALQDETRLNTPEWLLKIWIEDYGLNTAAHIAKANLAEAPLDITVKDLSALSYWGESLEAAKLPTDTLRRAAGGAIQDLDGFNEGDWWIQDASAAIPAGLFGDIKGQPVLDLCAAPGGKTLQLAAKGAHVTAIDRSITRLKRLEDNIRRMGLENNVTITCADAANWQPAAPAPYILLDAPCSATGTIRRHPDVPHLKTPRDLPGLLKIQAAILSNAFDMLIPGGILIYCTCSLQKSEGETQITAFLNANPAAKRLPITKDDLEGIDEFITPEGDIRIFPHHMAELGGMDGFFIARLTKSK